MKIDWTSLAISAVPFVPPVAALLFVAVMVLR